MTPPPPQSAAPQRLLIVRPSALGDVSRTVPALVTLRQHHPDAQIDWLVNAGFVDAVRHHPMLDRVIPFDRAALHMAGLRPAATRAALALRRQLRDARYDTVYDLQGLFRSGLLTWATRAPRRVGFANARELGHLGYNVKHPVNESLHTVDRMLALLEADGLTPSHDMRIYLGDDDQQWLARFLDEHRLAPQGYACLAPTARWLSKCWPAERYAEIATRLLDSGLGGDRLIVLAAPSEGAQVRALLDALPAAARERVLVPGTSVGQLMALLSATRLLVGNDSAALHIAVGFNRPAVAVFGPTDPALVGPYRREASVVQPPGAPDDARHNYRDHDDQTLIARVPVDAVWRRVQAEANRTPAG
ncbi:MAG: glycosyltransferase family 9 protein [Phycisphaeraceae bacterium]